MIKAMEKYLIYGFKKYGIFICISGNSTNNSGDGYLIGAFEKSPNEKRVFIKHSKDIKV
jgi:hypothetical protein